MATRHGLSQLTTSARNSPYNKEAIFNGKQTVPVEPIKIAHNKRFKPLVPSPLTTDSTYFGVVENKENASTQTKKPVTTDGSYQTIVSVPHILPKLTADDLNSDVPTTDYLQVLSYRKTLDLAAEEKRMKELLEEWGKLNEEIEEGKVQYEMLKEVAADVEKEKKEAEEVGTSDI